MLDINEVWPMLVDQRQELIAAQMHARKQFACLHFAFGNFIYMDRAEIVSKFKDTTYVGAWPTKEFDTHSGFIPIKHGQWFDDQVACLWAEKVLNQQPTLAVAHDFIFPQQNNPVAIGLSQISVVSHLVGAYRYQTHSELLLPEPVDVNGRCFALMIDELCTYMQENAKAVPKLICFIEGTLTYPVGKSLSADYRRLHSQAVQKLLKISKETGIPIISYTPAPKNQDWGKLLAYSFELDPVCGVADSELILHAYEMLPGHRTHLLTYTTHNEGDDKTFYQDLCFTYLNTGEDQLSRIEMPRWILQHQGKMLDHIFEVTWAHCLLGAQSNPLILKIATERAQLSSADHRCFYALLPLLLPTSGITQVVTTKPVGALDGHNT